MAEQSKSREPNADITIRVFQPDHGEDGMLYQNRQIIPIEYFSDTRYHGYVEFQFLEMYEDMVRALKEKKP